MKFLTAVKEKFSRADERVEASLDKHKDKYQAMAVLGGILVLATSAITGNASAVTANENAVYAGMSVIDIVLLAIGAVGFVAALFLRDFRVLIVSVVVLVLAGVAFYLGL
jgi:hypothetical protein